MHLIEVREEHIRQDLAEAQFRCNHSDGHTACDKEQKRVIDRPEIFFPGNADNRNKACERRQDEAKHHFLAAD